MAKFIYENEKKWASWSAVCKDMHHVHTRRWFSTMIDSVL